MDRETTGVLLLAKSLEVKKKFIEQFRDYQVKKRYLAIVEGVPKKQCGKIENYLIKKKEYSGQTIWGSNKNEKGLYAYTDWKLLKANTIASLIECYPKTGRTHQIRVHLCEMGHPLLGDNQYGGGGCSSGPIPRILLHAESLEFFHPFTKRNCMRACTPSGRF